MTSAKVPVVEDRIAGLSLTRGEASKPHDLSRLARRRKSVVAVDTVRAAGPAPRSVRALWLASLASADEPCPGDGIRNYERGPCSSALADTSVAVWRISSRNGQKRKFSRRPQFVPRSNETSVVLPYVPQGLLEHVVVANRELNLQRLAEHPPTFLIASNCGLPALKAHSANNLVDPVDDVNDDNRRLIGLEGLEQLR